VTAVYVAAHLGTRIWGGAERATTLLLAGLQARGHRVLLLCNAPLVAERAEALGVPSRVLAIGGDVALPHALRFAAALRRDPPDALVVATWKKVLWASLGAKLAGVPRVIARVGLEGDGPRRAKYRIALSRWVDAVVVNSERIRPPFAALPGWADRVTVIHNGVHPPVRHLPDGAVRAELGIAPGALVVGSVGRLVSMKRFDRLLDAVARIDGVVHVVLAGDGPRREELMARVEGLGMGNRLHLLGWRSDAADVLAACDAYAVTSDREGMSNAMLEALACGLPVVSTPVSGAHEALAPLEDGDAPGIVTAGFDAAEVGDALRSILGDPSRRAAMAAAARRVAEERFGFGRMLDRWEAVLGVEGR
jgi:glycosyltransferase involved in cell wall biosynthesis